MSRPPEVSATHEATASAVTGRGATQAEIGARLGGGPVNVSRLLARLAAATPGEAAQLELLDLEPAEDANTHDVDVNVHVGPASATRRLSSNITLSGQDSEV